MTVIALPGFLGGPADWQQVRAMVPEVDWLLVDPLSESALSPSIVSLDSWGKTFVDWLSPQVNGPLILVGYSQGARLALHALEAAPSLFSRLILLSANPGLDEADSAGRDARRAQDEVWARRFETEDWETVLRDWNAQGVFAGGRNEPPREALSRGGVEAAAALRSWSLAGQKDFRPLLRRFTERLDWLVGERDSKFIAIAESLRTSVPGLRINVVRESGHRIHFDDPQAVADRLRSAIGLTPLS